MDWDAATTALDARGVAELGPLLRPEDCDALIALYDETARFRSTVFMAQHGFGSGEYRYFAYPLPEPVASLRAELYEHLAPIANAWCERLSLDTYPEAHAAFLDRCHAAGQARPTPLLLRYGSGDFNRLHRDLYGPLLFPLQVVVQLSRPGEDFTGGELVVVENVPRMQARATVMQPAQGEAVVFAVNERPAQGSRGWHRVNLRHGVSTVRSGRRHALGVIFHDAA